MKKLKLGLNRNTFIAGLILAFALGFLSALIFAPGRYRDALERAAEGDIALYFGGPEEALAKYEEAQNLWPFLRFDKRIKTRIEEFNTQVRESPSLSILMSTDASNEEMQALASEVEGFGGVRQVEAITKEQAYQEYLERNQDSPDPVTQENASRDLIPGYIQVYLEDFSKKGEIAQNVEARENVDRVITSPYSPISL